MRNRSFKSCKITNILNLLNDRIFVLYQHNILIDIKDLIYHLWPEYLYEQ